MKNESESLNLTKKKTPSQLENFLNRESKKHFMHIFINKPKNVYDTSNKPNSRQIFEIRVSFD